MMEYRKGIGCTYCSFFKCRRRCFVLGESGRAVIRIQYLPEDFGQNFGYCVQYRGFGGRRLILLLFGVFGFFDARTRTLICILQDLWNLRKRLR